MATQCPDFHRLQVAQHCRVCAGKLTRVTYQCSKKKDQLLKYLGVNVEADLEGVHPQVFCNTCWAKLKKIEKATASGTVARTSLLQTPFSWAVHGDTCTTCEHFKQKSLGGRPRKRKNIPSCPSSVVTHIHSIAGPRHQSSAPLLPSRFFSSSSPSFSLSDVVCSSCHNVVDQPVELICKTLVCLECCLNLLKKDRHACPSCGQHHDTVNDSFNQPSPVIQKLIDNLVLHCDVPQCNSPILLQHLGHHVESGCTTYVRKAAESLTLEQVLQQPMDTPVTSLESNVLGQLASRALREGTITVATGSLGTGVSNKVHMQP